VEKFYVDICIARSIEMVSVELPFSTFHSDNMHTLRGTVNLFVNQICVHPLACLLVFIVARVTRTIHTYIMNISHLYICGDEFMINIKHTLVAGRFFFVSGQITMCVTFSASCHSDHCNFRSRTPSALKRQSFWGIF
jgi:hypothetical protein